MKRKEEVENYIVEFMSRQREWKMRMFKYVTDKVS